MPKYMVEPKIFELFPDFRRGVIVAAGIDNNDSGAQVAAQLGQTISAIGARLPASGDERITVWNSAYEKFSVNPKKFTPSICFLVEQLRRGKPPRSVNKIVDLFNIISLKWLVPCGGDDLDKLQGGDLCLGIANGDENFAPLFKPEAIESPDAGEVIYYTPQTKRVMCRRWTWRNADFSKLSEQTKRVAINIDMMMPPFKLSDLQDAMMELAELVQKFCGGKLQTHIFSPETPELQIEL